MKKMNFHSSLNALSLIAAVVTFLFHLIPFYGMIIGIPIYLINLMICGLRYANFDRTDQKIIIWLPLVPIGVWVFIGLLTISF